MFTGIIEALGLVVDIQDEGTNRIFTIESTISSDFHVDQSIAHNGVCLTVTSVKGNRHEVIAVQETLKKSNLGVLSVGDRVNLERSLTMNRLLDGHLVQGHVDTKATCVTKENKDGSWLFTFEFDPSFKHLLVDKGSISINGVSLTLIEPSNNRFTVTIIPYTFQHTTFRYLEEKQTVNIEFDILGKYIWRQVQEMNFNK